MMGGDEIGGDKGVEKMKDEKNEKSHFVLVHGISNGAWCWYKLSCLLENSGYKVTCLDLKGCGKDLTDPNTILSFHDYNQPLLHFLSSLTDNDQVILVGPSAGGLCLSDAIIKFGKKRIKLAIFVAATMLKSGFATDQDIKDEVPDLSEFGELNEVYEMGFRLGEDCPPTTILIKKELQRKIIYQLSPLEDSTLLKAQFADPVDADDVPRIYIKTTHDNVMKPHQQEAMTKKWPPSDVYVLESDHTPFFSAPFFALWSFTQGCNFFWMLIYYYAQISCVISKINKM